jgi:hypothetical protein
MSYSFRVFAAIFDHSVVEGNTDSSAMRCFYGNAASGGDEFFIPARYVVGGSAGPQRGERKWRYGNEDVFLFHGVDAASGRPDWLGEIFEWLSCTHEHAATRRDSVGRIPYDASIFGERRLSPRKPYATILMSCLENEMCGASRTPSFLKAPSPLPGVEHMVICSHDVDFYYTNKRSALLRLAKNLVIACKPYRNRSFAASNFRMILDVLSGKRVGDYLPALFRQGVKANFQSTLFAVPRQIHRRDPNYEISEIVSRLDEAGANGFSVGMHASYTSIIEGGTLLAETAAMEKALARKAIANRQHWLRFDSHEKLYRAVADAKLAVDSSLGFSDQVGFRNGASFAFPPYDLENEKTYEFLEIPLVIMDGSLEAASRASKENPQDVADEVLQASRRWSWGGVSVLWHNPIEPISVPKEINRVFWDSVGQKESFQERWMTAEEFLRVSLGRYQAAGLLKDIPFHA